MLLICISSCRRLFALIFLKIYAQEAMTYVHNRFVEMLLETGLLGFVPFMIFLGVIMFFSL